MNMSIIVLFLICILVFNYFMAEEFYEVSMMKGFLEKKYFWICFFLGIIGYLLVISLPDRAEVKKETAQETAQETVQDLSEL